MSISDIIRVVMAALHDVSKHDDQRLDPKANASDTRAQRDATGTISVHPVTDATTNRNVLRTANGQAALNNGTRDIAIYGLQADGTINLKFFDSTGVGIAQFGQFPGGSLALKVAKPGFEVSTTSDANLIFNTANNIFKIIKIVDMTTSVVYVANATPNGNQTAVSTTAHGLGLSPTFIANIKMDANASAQNGNSSTDNYPNPGQLTGWVGSHLVDYVKATVTVDATNVYFRVMMDTLGFTNQTYTFTATVYLLQETFVA